MATTTSSKVASPLVIPRREEARLHRRVDVTVAIVRKRPNGDEVQTELVPSAMLVVYIMLSSHAKMVPTKVPLAVRTCALKTMSHSNLSNRSSRDILHVGFISSMGSARSRKVLNLESYPLKILNINFSRSRLWGNHENYLLTMYTRLRPKEPSTISPQER